MFLCSRNANSYHIKVDAGGVYQSTGPRLSRREGYAFNLSHFYLDSCHTARAICFRGKITFIMFYSQYNTVVACHMCLSLHKPLLSPFSTACTKYDLYRTSLCYKNLRVRPQLPMLLVAWRIKAPLLYHPTTYTSSATTLGKPTSNEERD